MAFFWLFLVSQRGEFKATILKEKVVSKTQKPKKIQCQFFLLSFGVFLGEGGSSKTRGAGKKQIDGPPRTFAKSQTHPPTRRLFFVLPFFLVRFWAFLGMITGVQKHH
jgi:hypothetical protein